MLDASSDSSEPPRMYKIVGADQKEYGPVSAEELRTWIKEGRANGQTMVKVEGGPWKPLSTFPEFAVLLGAPPPSAVPPGTAPPPSLAQMTYASRGPQTNSMAIAGLVMGILSVTVGLLCCGPLFNLLGIVFSLVALSQIKKSPDQQTGRGLAIAGLIMSILGLIAFLVIVAFGFLGGFIHALQ
jgi:Domain of unknown function (DUF4190)/GYF domain 2